MEISTAALPEAASPTMWNTGILFVNAHPDDEAMLMSGAMINAQELGHRVCSLIATDGGATTIRFENPDRPWPKDTTIEAVRREEAERSHQAIGVSGDCLEFLGLPDGRLAQPFNRLRLSLKIARMALKQNVSILVTPGEQGFDGHADHVAVHQATLTVAKWLGRVGKKLTVYGLNSEGRGRFVVPVDPGKKLGILSHHWSQFPMWRSADSQSERVRWGYYLPNHTAEYINRYEGLLSKETYDLYYNKEKS